MINGTIAAVVTISQNITERKCAEIALRESERNIELSLIGQMMVYVSFRTAF